MPISTPPRLPGSRNNPLSSINSRPGASKPLTSIAHVNRETNKPLTSIAHVNNPEARAASSINRVMNPRTTIHAGTAYSQEEEEAITNALREKYVAQRLKEKRAAAEDAKKKDNLSKNK